MLTRRVEPELLDELPPEDSRAIHSRADLRRVNRVMGNAAIIAGWLNRSDRISTAADSVFLVELGAGDGTLLLDVARRTAGRMKHVTCLLVDRQRLLTRDTRDRFKSLSWDVSAEQADAFDWLDGHRSLRADAVIANLFLHHFSDERLRVLLAAASRHAQAFLACEPLRSRTALAAASLVPLIGGNGVSLHDARLSVRAGFTNHELSSLWPNDPRWTLCERKAGPFTHGFEAYRTS
jgi:hypothetical protein